MAEIKYEIVEHIGDIAESSSGSRTNTGYSAIEFKYFDLLRKGL